MSLTLAMSLITNVYEAVRNDKAYLGASYSGRFRLPKRADNPFKMDYNLELDISQEPNFNWHPQVDDLGRMDMINKVSFLLSHLALPREGHLDAAAHVMAYIVHKYRSRQVYGPSYLEIDHRLFKKCDW